MVRDSCQRHLKNIKYLIFWFLYNNFPQLCVPRFQNYKIFVDFRFPFLYCTSSLCSIAGLTTHSNIEIKSLKQNHFCLSVFKVSLWTWDYYWKCNFSMTKPQVRWLVGWSIVLSVCPNFLNFCAPIGALIPTYFVKPVTYRDISFADEFCFCK